MSCKDDEALPYSVLNDHCDGDVDGLQQALRAGYTVVYENYEEYDYEHSGDVIFKLADGHYIHASCGACSCGGSGEWAYYDTEEQARARCSP